MFWRMLTARIGRIENITVQPKQAKKFLVLTSVLLFSLFSASSMALDTDVSGDWEITVSSQRGEMTWDVKFEQEENNLTVIMTGQRGQVTGEGTFTGKKIEWTTTRSTPRGEMSMTWSGEVEGNTISGEVQFGSFGSSSWEGTKKTI